MVLIFALAIALICNLFKISVVDNEKYQELAKKEENVVFGGRLGQYKYYDMDQVILAALDRCEKEFNQIE